MSDILDKYVTFVTNGGQIGLKGDVTAARTRNHTNNCCPCRSCPHHRPLLPLHVLPRYCCRASAATL